MNGSFTTWTMAIMAALLIVALIIQNRLKPRT